MSQLLELADRLRTIGEELPVGQVAGAAGRLRAASGLLAWTMHASPRPNGAPMLSLAGEHLDRAAGAMLAAREALDGYLVAIGLPRDGVPPENRDWHAPLKPSQPATVDRARLVDFWADRVDFLADRVGERRPDRDPKWTAADLLHRAAAAALDEDPALVRRRLVTAAPAAGLGLAGLTPPLVRHLTAELVGHPPRADDFPAVRKRVVPRLAKLLPNLAEEVADDQLARACRADLPPRDNPHHPVDAAVAGAVLVAALLGLTRRGAEDLAKVSKDLAEQTEDEEQQARLRREAAEKERHRRDTAGVHCA